MHQKIVNKEEIIRKLKALGFEWHVLITGICVIGLHRIKIMIGPYVKDLKDTGMSFDEFLHDFYGIEYSRMIGLSDTFRAVLRELWEMS